MKRLLLTTALLMLLLCALVLPQALADSRGVYTDEPPAEVAAHIAEKYPAYTLEDYILISGTPKGDYGFALISKTGDRRLLGYHADGGTMKYYLNSGDAVMQGNDDYVFFSRHDADETYDPDFSSGTYGNTWGFTVVRIRKEYEEMWWQTIVYHWEDGNFLLRSFFSASTDQYVYITDRNVRYVDVGLDKVLGYVQGTVQRDIRYVSYSALPKTYEDAKKSLTVAPTIPVGELTATSIKFTGGKNYPVYSAPSTDSLRGGNGKAAVSTNDWIQVFGQENGYILIQYAISSDKMRFGYIDAASLPKSASVQSFSWHQTAATLTQDTALTDDPLNSHSALLTLKKGERVSVLATTGTWAYVETTASSWARGFVPQNVLQYSRVADLASQSGGKVSGTMTLYADNTVTIDLTVPNGQRIAYFLLLDGSSNQLATLPKTDSASNRFQFSGTLSGNTAFLRFIPVYSDGIQGEELFNVIW